MTILRTVAATCGYWFDLVCARVLDALDTTPATYGPLDFLAEYDAWAKAQRRFISDDTVIAELEQQFTKDWS